MKEVIYFIFGLPELGLIFMGLILSLITFLCIFVVVNAWKECKK
jgi:hypothetical protein